MVSRSLDRAQLDSTRKTSVGEIDFFIIINYSTIICVLQILPQLDRLTIYHFFINLLFIFSPVGQSQKIVIENDVKKFVVIELLEI